MMERRLESPKQELRQPKEVTIDMSETEINPDNYMKINSFKNSYNPSDMGEIEERTVNEAV